MGTFLVWLLIVLSLRKAPVKDARGFHKLDSASILPGWAILTKRPMSFQIVQRVMEMTIDKSSFNEKISDNTSSYR